MSIRVFNTLTKRREELVPMEPGVIRMFVCGPTVYDLSHVGHAKTYTQFDFIARYLKTRGFKVTYAQNLTDVDDKIIRRANELGVEPRELAARYEAMYMEDMAALHNTSVSVYARAHDYIEQIVQQVEQLIDRGHAYQLDDGWYFDLSTFPDYGKLSGRTEVNPEDSVARIDEHDKKRNPGDFALWKARKADEPFWDTRLGPGRPGWHIEDTAITESLFGPQYDLHGGAVDLIFPHHEAEVAQMEAASGKVPLVRYWMHTGLLRVAGGAKMAKSAGNFMTIREALETTDFRTLRYAFLSQHYRSSMELNTVALESARSARRRVENFYRSIDTTKHDEAQDRAQVAQAREHFFRHLDEDFDTPGALAALFDFIRSQNKSGGTPGAASAEFIHEVNDLFDTFDLGVPASTDNDIEAILEQRRTLRKAGNYTDADRIRAELAERGIVIEDTADGTRWWHADKEA